MAFYNESDACAGIALIFWSDIIIIIITIMLSNDQIGSENQTKNEVCIIKDF